MNGTRWLHSETLNASSPSSRAVAAAAGPAHADDVAGVAAAASDVELLAAPSRMPIPSAFSINPFSHEAVGAAAGTNGRHPPPVSYISEPSLDVSAPPAAPANAASNGGASAAAAPAMVAELKQLLSALVATVEGLREEVAVLRAENRALREDAAATAAAAAVQH